MRGKARAPKGLLSKLLQSSGLGDSIFFVSTLYKKEKEPRTGARALSEGSCAQPGEQGSLRQVTGETKAHGRGKKASLSNLMEETEFRSVVEAPQPRASPHPVGALYLVLAGDRPLEAEPGMTLESGFFLLSRILRLGYKVF